MKTRVKFGVNRHLTVLKVNIKSIICAARWAYQYLLDRAIILKINTIVPIWKRNMSFRINVKIPFQRLSVIATMNIILYSLTFKIYTVWMRNAEWQVIVSRSFSNKSDFRTSRPRTLHYSRSAETKTIGWSRTDSRRPTSEISNCSQDTSSALGEGSHVYLLVVP